jgi:hypothetical protein
MRSLVALLSLCALASAQEPLPAKKSPFVVHEWGTFTSLQGSSGITLEGLQREEEALPDFVHEVSTAGVVPIEAGRVKGLAFRMQGVTQKMETPVLYFHGATPPRVRVRVDFVGGLISQWYPLGSASGPDVRKTCKDGVLDLTRLERSFLQWDVDLLPQGGPALARMPKVKADDPWQFAREVDAALVATAQRLDDGTPREAERYLFYRGIGRFTLPVSVRAEQDGKGVLRNGGERIPFALAMQVEGGRGRYQVLPVVDQQVGFDLAAQPWLPAERMTEELKEIVQRALVAQRMFRDEAVAMARTWARSWFRSHGARVLWMVPRATVDRLLPLQITPRPDVIERALVGRLEFLTPEVEATVAAALARGDKDFFKQFDRFAEPVLRRALQCSADQKVAGAARAMLAEL